jgi:hypothetical protein
MINSIPSLFDPKSNFTQSTTCKIFEQFLVLNVNLDTIIHKTNNYGLGCNIDQHKRYNANYPLNAIKIQHIFRNK